MHGIKELPDERSFGVLLREIGSAWPRAEGLLDEVPDGAREREALDALRAPLGADLVAAHTPHLLRVGLEEGEIELSAEAVDEEVFEAFLRPTPMKARLDVAKADLRGPGKA